MENLFNKVIESGILFPFCGFVLLGLTFLFVKWLLTPVEDDNAN